MPLDSLQLPTSQHPTQHYSESIVRPLYQIVSWHGMICLLQMQLLFSEACSGVDQNVIENGSPQYSVESYFIK